MIATSCSEQVTEFLTRLSDVPNHYSGYRVSPVAIARLEAADTMNTGMNMDEPFSLSDSTAATCTPALTERRSWD